MLETYDTFSKEFKTEFKERKSRFICFGKRIESEQEALVEIKTIKKEYFSAKHNVYVYKLLGGKLKFSGDGEPQGSAAEPILNVINGYTLENVLVVITRYFGGVLLGVGGLVRAYTKGAQLVVSGCQISTFRFCTIFESYIDYSLLNIFLNLMKKNDVKVLETEYLELIKLKGYCECEHFILFNDKVIEIFKGKLNLKIIDKKFF